MFGEQATAFFRAATRGCEAACLFVVAPLLLSQASPAAAVSYDIQPTQIGIANPQVPAGAPVTGFGVRTTINLWVPFVFEIPAHPGLQVTHATLTVTVAGIISDQPVNNQADDTIEVSGTAGRPGTILKTDLRAPPGVPVDTPGPITLDGLQNSAVIEGVLNNESRLNVAVEDDTSVLSALLHLDFGPILPNLAPNQPAGWSDKIVVSVTTGTNTDSNPLSPSATLYVDWSVENTGGAATAARFYTALSVDGVVRNTWYTDPPLDPNASAGVLDYSIGMLSVGTHSITITTDSTGTIAESNEADNSYTKTITVGAPNLTPYQPPGWSDKVVVSTTTGTTTDSDPLSAADTLYVDWAILNNGTTATAARFYTALSVDGVLRNTWYSDPPINPNSYVSVTDYSIGMLSAGTHTITITTDSTDAIAESNEADNSYTKTITIRAVGIGRWCTTCRYSLGCGVSTCVPV